jgi:hypothetical protein
VQISHRNSNLRIAFELHVDSFTRVAAHTTAVFADAIFAGRLTIHFAARENNCELHRICPNVHHFERINFAKRPISSFHQAKLSL